jgi:hypothetical protein
VVEEAEGEGRVGENVYEVFQVQAHVQLKETVLFKIDTGANVTLWDRILYDHDVRIGYIRRDRKLRRPLAVKGIGGRTACRRVGDLSGYPSVPDGGADVERAHQVLLGTDNLDMLGAVIDRNEKCTTYKRVPDRRKPVQSMHLNSTAAQRQFIAHRVGCDEAQVPHDPTQGAVPGDKRGRSEGVDPEDKRWKSQECLVEEVVAENKGRHHARYCDAQEVTAELDEAEVGNIERHMHHHCGNMW